MTNKRQAWAYAVPIFYVAPILMAMHATPVFAQITRPPPQAEISRQRIQPLPLPDTPLQLRIQNPEKASVPRAVDEIVFSINRIKVTGATHFPEARWRTIFASLEGQKIVLSDLREAADKLENLYRADGFFLTRVFIAPQEVRDGTLEVQVVEGFLANAFVQAPNDPSRKLTQTLITPVLSQRPVRFLDLEQRLLLLNDTPGMAVTSVLRPGGVLGSSDILLTAVKPPRTAFAAVDNSGSDVVGPINYSLGTTIFQPFGRPGALDLSLAMSGEGFRELQAVSGRYATPLGNNGAVGSIGALVAHAAPGGPIRDLDVQSKSGSLSASLRVPLLRSRANSIYLDAGMTLNRSFVKALGTEINDDRSTVASLGLQWRQIGWLAGDMTFGVNLLHGLDLFGANNANAPLPSVLGFNPHFLRATYQFQRNQQIRGPIGASMALQGQYTANRLLSGEQISFGGSSIGRGYDPSSVTGERGIGVIGELHASLPGVQVPNLIEGVQVYAFADWARTTALAYEETPKQSAAISSLGVGARFTLLRQLSVDTQFSSARRALPDSVKGDGRFTISAILQF
ncbi:ShlB/FhaC/HecB family hemolysin secretion/activation protein [Sphingorhabdus sp. EL138]|uniref:ShlB/FhaC/HecB family hemolysin secretion/activation protein n=1 Tax=Sphingorhabdus sp. EL138 TaxID=2073156 RepID=UPI0025DE4D85|nr:ShlB/FhaC/HecB family hemolysin secretion/activation protein [Sphingorhabdus sp. EL138]